MFRKIAKAIAMIQDAIFSRRAGREYAWLLPMLISFLIKGDPYVHCGTPASAAPTAGSARMMPFYRGGTAELRSRQVFPFMWCRSRTLLACSADLREYSGLPSRIFSSNVPVSASGNMPEQLPAMSRFHTTRFLGCLAPNTVDVLASAGLSRRRTPSSRSHKPGSPKFHWDTISHLQPVAGSMAALIFLTS
ncbi:hypothetical protein [Paraburkholderia terrae]|uniref:hypothetical protein n=1 Tax=Paraburkholderia terrae TaxID=311230 RepID=UPI0033654E36